MLRLLPLSLHAFVVVGVSATIAISLVSLSCAPAFCQEAEVADQVSEVDPSKIDVPNAGQMEDQFALPASSDGKPLTAEQLKQDPEYNAELEKRMGGFSAAKAKLVDAVTLQRKRLIEFRNGEANSSEDRRLYLEVRNDVRKLLNEVYQAALYVSWISSEAEPAQYIVTMIKHRVESGIYDLETAEGATRIIDGGGRLIFLFKGSARSAVASGQFKLARQIYEVMDEDKLDDVDRRFINNMDILEEEYLREVKIREREAEADNLPRVKLETTQGDVILELFLNDSPSTVANFIGLVEDGFYDGLDFHQVVDDILALTGDPSGMGGGNTGKFLIDEKGLAEPRVGLRGSLVMAKVPLDEKSGEFYPNSASCMFAILYTPIPKIGEGQTIFGRVIEGMEAISYLRRVDPSKEKEKNKIILPSDRILKATVIRRPESLPVPKYVEMPSK